MKIYDHEIKDLKNATTHAAMDMTAAMVSDPDWLDVLHPDAHPLKEHLLSEPWFNRLVAAYPRQEEAIIEECRMQIESFDKVKAEDYDFLFAVIERENCCMLDALDIMNSEKYEWLDGLDLEDVAYELAADCCRDDWLLEYVNLDSLEQDLRMGSEYTEHDGGVLRRR